MCMILLQCCLLYTASLWVLTLAFLKGHLGKPVSEGERACCWWFSIQRRITRIWFLKPSGAL
jgi:hypothetical protein